MTNIIISWQSEPQQEGLPAQKLGGGDGMYAIRRVDQAHNEVLSDTAHQQPECTQCGDTGRSYPTLENPDGVVCDCMLNKE